MKEELMANCHRLKTLELFESGLASRNSICKPDPAPKTIIEHIGKDHFTIIISRKSRIIMSDGKKILEKVKKIKKMLPQSKVSLKTTAPVCSKTTAFLKKHKIEIL